MPRSNSSPRRSDRRDAVGPTEAFFLARREPRCRSAPSAATLPQGVAAGRERTLPLGLVHLVKERPSALADRTNPQPRPVQVPHLHPPWSVHDGQHSSDYARSCHSRADVDRLTRGPIEPGAILRLTRRTMPFAGGVCREGLSLTREGRSARTRVRAASAAFVTGRIEIPRAHTAIVYLSLMAGGEVSTAPALMLAYEIEPRRSLLSALALRGSLRLVA